MQFKKESLKTVREVVQNIQNNASNHKFGVLHIHNVAQTLKSKGLEFEEECEILDVCNPNVAKTFLEKNMELSSIMPCKISVYSKNGQTFVVMNSIPTLVEPIEKELVSLAKETENILKNLIIESI